MIIKSFQINKDVILDGNFFLFHGKNEGLQNEVIQKNFIKNFRGQISKYDENGFIQNFDIIISELINKSFFDDEKLIIVSRVSDKITKFINDIKDRKLNDVKLVLKSHLLDKKSKLRNLFEKDKVLIAVPFYEDSDKSLSSIIIKFINENNIKLSREAVNLLADKSQGDRNNLKLELDKIFHYSLTNKNISFENIQKLTNLAENYDVSDLANNYLSRNKKKVAKILNENNYSDEDCILILRTILSKSKRLLSIIKTYKESNNIDFALSNYKPPIFWKEKESVKIQANSWKLEDLKSKIYKINEIEGLIKKNSKNSLNIVSDFIVNY